MNLENINSSFKNYPEGSGNRALDADEKKLNELRARLEALLFKYQIDPDDKTMTEIKRLQALNRKIKQDEQAVARTDIVQ